MVGGRGGGDVLEERVHSEDVPVKNNSFLFSF